LLFSKFGFGWKPRLGALPCLLLFSLTLACFVERPIFDSPVAFNDDTRNQVYWMARIQHPGLFQHDYIADYFTQPLLISPVVSVIYQFAGHWMDPLRFSHLLPFILVLLSTLFLFKYAENAVNRHYAAWVCFCFNASIWIFKNLAGGLPRAFFYPLFFAFLWAHSTQRWKLIPPLLWLSMLIYPSVALLGLMLLLFETGIAYFRHIEQRRAQLICTGWALIGTGLTLAGRVFLSSEFSRFGPVTTADLAEKMRVFYHGGRLGLFALNYTHDVPQGLLGALYSLIQKMPQPYLLIPIFIFSMFILGYNRFLKPRWGALIIPSMIWRSLVASSLLYSLAWGFLFYLYVPERYLQYTFPMIPSFMLAGIVLQLQQKYPAMRKKIGIAFVGLTLLGTGFFWRSDLPSLSDTEQSLYTALTPLPETVMIASPPAVASDIPLYAFKSVLLSNEAYIPFHQRYFNTMHARLKDWLLAYYATDSHTLAKFIEKYHIDYLVIQKGDFQKKRFKNLQKRHYFAFDASFFNTLKHMPSERYALMRLPKTCVFYENSDFRVIDTQRLLKLET
jgi:hypothetical protein